MHSALVLLFLLHCILTSSGNEDQGREDAHRRLRNEGHLAADLSPRIERLRQWRLNQVLLDAPDKAEESVNNSSVALPTQRTGLGYAVNYLDPDTGYEHHNVFHQMHTMLEDAALAGQQAFGSSDKDILTEFTGLKVPAYLDCHLPDGSGGTLCGYDYYLSVPSRQMSCRAHALVTALAPDVAAWDEGELVARIMERYPNYPVVDEEYWEAAYVYRSALDTQKSSFAMAEIGARWGTWGFRAAAAVRRFSPHVRNTHLYFQETCRQGCDAIGIVQELNGFSSATGVHVVVDCMEPEAGVSTDTLDWIEQQAHNLLDWSEHHHQIDVVDMDCEGCELHLFSSFVDKLAPVWNKTKQLIIATHHFAGNMHVHRTLQELGGWTVVHELPGVRVDMSMSSRALKCRDKIRVDAAEIDRSWVWQNCQDTVRWDARSGPVLEYDGEIIAVNNRLATA